MKLRERGKKGGIVHNENEAPTPQTPPPVYLNPGQRSLTPQPQQHKKNDDYDSLRRQQEVSFNLQAQQNKLLTELYDEQVIIFLGGKFE